MITTLPKSLLEASGLLLEASLYESILLLEDRIDFLKKNNPTIDTSHDHLAIFNKPDEIIDHFANVGDPSKNKQHTQWILGQYKKKNVRQEDMYRVRDALTNFDKYKSKLDKKDINQYKTLGELEGAIHPLKGTAATNSEVKQETITKGRTLIHDNGKGLKVYRLEPNEEGKAASQELYGGGHEAGGTHTSWCTAARSEHCMFDYYSKEEPLHVIHTPSGNVYQAHPATKQLMDAKDSEFEPEFENDDGSKMIKNKDLTHVSTALEHIPNGWKLKFSHNFPDIKPSEIDKAVDSDDSVIAATAAKHPNISEETAEKASNRHDDGNIRGALASNHSIPQHIAEKLLNDKSSLVRDYAALNHKLSASMINSAYEKYNDNSTASSWFRANLAKNPNASQELMKKALGDTETVAAYAMENPSMNSDTIRYAVNQDPKLIFHAVSHPNATPDILDKGLNDEGWQNQYTQIKAAQHPNMSKENLHKALDSSVEAVRGYAVSHKNADITHIERGINDSKPFVRKEAIKSDLIHPHHIEKVLKDDDDDFVKGAALKHKNATSEILDRYVSEHPEMESRNHASYVINHHNVSSSTVDKLINKFPTMVATKSKLTPEQIEKLSNHQDVSVRTGIAKRTDIGHDIIRKLANDKNEIVRNWIKRTHGVSND